MPPSPGRRLPPLPRQRPEVARRRSAFFRRVPLGLPIARTTSNATRHHVEAWPPLHDFRRILRAHPGVNARPRALDPLITGLASSSMRRSPTSAIGRSASTHLRTPTPDVPDSGCSADAAPHRIDHRRAAPPPAESRCRPRIRWRLRGQTSSVQGHGVACATQCIPPPRWLAGGAWPQTELARTPHVTRTVHATTETSLLTRNTPQANDESLDCPDNGRAASHARSRKRARFAAPEVPSTSKTPARGAPALRALVRAGRMSQAAPLRSSLVAVHGRATVE